MLAHSAVFFSREEWLPVADARGWSKNTAATDQEATNEQVGAEGGAGTTATGGVGASTEAAGSGSIVGAGPGAGSQGSFSVGGTNSDLSRVSGSGNVSVVNVSSSDPDVVEAALASNTATTADALAANASVSNTALDDLESGATASIAAGVAYTQLNDQFGEDALQSAANAEANSTTALEAMGTESETTANNALAAAQNETLAGVTPAQQFQAVEPNTPGTVESGNLTKLATWISVIAGALAIFFYLTKKKA